MRQQSKRYLYLFTFILCLVVGSNYCTDHTYLLTPRSRDKPSPKTAIITTDTREPQVELDPSIPLSSWTVTTLSNHLYALAIGAKYVYYAIDPPVTGKLPPVKYRPKMEGYCEHQEHGWRTAHFCKLPFVWWFMRENKEIESFIYNDSDALFRDPQIDVDRHLELLSPERPFGVMTNHPYDNGANSGYCFMRRFSNPGTGVSDAYRDQDEEQGHQRQDWRKPAYDIEDFVLEWWNEDWGKTLFQFYDQSTLRRMIGGNAYGAKGVGPPREKVYLDQVVLLDEWAFQLRTPDQMILHINHHVADRDEQLAQAWVWGEEYPLSDRVKLAQLLKEVDIRKGSAGAITKQMPLSVPVLEEGISVAQDEGVL